MIGLNEVEKLIKLVLLSAHIYGEKPLSALLISKVETGKSQLLSKFSEIPYTVMPSDVTAWGIARHYGKDIREGKIRHILIPEFSIPISRNWDTVRALDAFLLGLIEEGVGEIVSHQWRFVTKAPYGCGIIACISNQDFKHHEKSWFRVGLMSRLLPISYEYSENTRQGIMKYIKERQYINEEKVELKLPEFRVFIDLPMQQADDIEKIVKDLITGTEMYGFRFQRHLQRLAMSHALYNDRFVVTDEDIEYINSIKEFINCDCRKEV